MSGPIRRKEYQFGKKEDWETLNPRLNVGDLAVSYPDGGIKVGDGESSYNELDSITALVSDAQQAVADAAADSALAALGHAQTAEAAADRAETSLAGVTLVAGSTGYQPDIATAESELSDGDVFWTVEGEEVVQYQIVSGLAEEIPGARLVSARSLNLLKSSVQVNNILLQRPLLAGSSFFADFRRQGYAIGLGKAPRLFSDMFTFERSSTGTYWGGDGFLKVAQSNEPRFDHNPATGEPLGLLVEGQRANALQSPTDLSGDGWFVVESSLLTVATGPHLDGVSTAPNTLVEGEGESFRLLRQSVAVTPGFWVASFVAQRGEGSRNINWYTNTNIPFGLSSGSRGVAFDLDAGTVKAASSGLEGFIVDLGKGRYRCIVRLPEVIEEGSLNYTLALAPEDSTSVTFPIYEGDGVSSVIVAHTQFERSSDDVFASSLILTNGTRRRDQISADVGSWYNPDAGALYAEFLPRPAAGGLGFSVIAGFDDGEAIPRINIFRNNASGGLATQIHDGESRTNSIGFSPPGVVTRAAFRFQSGNRDSAVNGVFAGWSDDGEMPEVSFLRLGFRFNGQPYFGHICAVSWLAQPLTNDELQAVTVDVSDGGVVQEPVTHNVDLLYTNLALSGSAGAEVIWWSDSATDTRIAYRLKETGDWIGAQATRTEDWPGRAGWYVHTAMIPVPSADATYDVRVVNGGYSDSIYVPPLSSIKLGLMADWQSPYFYGSGSRMEAFGQVLATRGVHAYVENGDYVNDDGRFDALYADRWREFMAAHVLHFRRDGAILPGVWSIGNHEGRNAAGTSNATTGGNGTPGQTPLLHSAGYYLDSPASGPFRSNSVVVIGSEVAIITLETDHTVPMIDQLEWFEATLADVAPKVRHIMVVGHAPAWTIGDTFMFDNPSQSGVLRELFWPAMQPYADQVRFFFAGHEHLSSDTGPKIMEPDGSGHESNRLRFRSVSEDEGIRQLVIGPASASNRYAPSARALEVSSLDESNLIVAAYGYNSSSGITETIGPISGMRNDFYTVGVAEFTRSGWSVDFIGTDGNVFYSVAPGG
jgi:hypothetical protein